MECCELYRMDMDRVFAVGVWARFSGACDGKLNGFGIQEDDCHVRVGGIELLKKSKGEN